MFKLITAMGIAAVAALVLGCGSEDETTATTTATANVTKAQFIKQADAVCAKIAKERESEVNAWQENYPGGPAKAEEDFESGLKEVIAPSMKREVEELEELPLPASDEQAVNKMIGNLAKGSRVLAEQGPEGIPTSGIPEFEQEAEAFGFKVCVNP